VLVNGLQQVVVAEIGHDEGVAVTDGGEQRHAHSARVDHQVDEQHLATVQHGQPAITKQPMKPNLDGRIPSALKGKGRTRSCG